MLAKNKEHIHRRWLNRIFVVMVALAAVIMLGVDACHNSILPEQLSPPDGSVFDHYPRTTTLKWSAVQGAVKYRVEVDCYHCCQLNAWCTDVGQEWDVKEVTTTSYTFDFVGAQPGRWRVSAINAGGEESQRTGWWGFEYTI